MIELGLQRISRLLQANDLRWKAIHVAGTNGKGSICAYISAMLNAGYAVGRFTSPHLIDRWDCISIKGQPVSSKQFFEKEQQISQRNQAQNIGASEFERLTTAAFELFSENGVQIAVVEVGLGGRLDATNVLPPSTFFFYVIAKIVIYN